MAVAPVPPQRPSRRRRRGIRRFSILRFLLLLLVYGVSLAAAVIYWLWTTYSQQLPADPTAALLGPARRSVALGTDGSELGSFYFENRKPFALERLPAHVVAAFIAAEDRRFWQHPGFDVFGIARAAIANFRDKEVSQGGSTLTQQLLKQTALAKEELLPADLELPADELRELRMIKKFERKLKEVILAARIERELTKAEILSMYLNHVYLGNGAQGVAAAAEVYFGKDVENLTIAEAAMLAGIVRSPGDRAPHLDYEAARGRQRYVLGRMLADKYISDAELAAAIAEPIALVEAGDINHLAAPYFVEQVRQKASKLPGQHDLFRSGMRIYTTLDPRLQAAAEAALRRGLEAVDRRLGFRGPIGRADAARGASARGTALSYRAGAEPLSTAADRLEVDGEYVAEITRVSTSAMKVDLGVAKAKLTPPDSAWVAAWQGQGRKLEVGDLIAVRVIDPAGEEPRIAVVQTPDVQAALVAMDKRGRVVAMVGGYDWATDRFNRAVQAKRQIGSAIKPFIYGAAFAAGRSQVERRFDGPVAVPTASGVWTPSNYDGKFTGWTTLRGALARSLNTIAVQLSVDVGVDRIIEIMRGFGISSAIPRHISISLGTPDLTLLEVTAAYAGIAAQGRKVTPRLWDLITTATGDVLDDRRGEGPGSQVLSQDVAYVLGDAMRAVITDGTAKAAQALGRPAAGKTGTSANYRDAWFIGYTADLVCGVWMGRDNSTPIGDKITGGGAAVPIWLEFMQQAQVGAPRRDFDVPPGVTFARADRASGAPRGPSGDAVWIPFSRGSMPTAFTKLPRNREPASALKQ